MRKIGKAYTFRIILLLIGSFFYLTNKSYSVDLSDKVNLRKPLIYNESVYMDIERVIRVADQLRSDKIKETNKRLQAKQQELIYMFRDVLEPLRDKNITVNRIERLFSSDGDVSRIFEVIYQIGEERRRKAVLENKIEDYMGLRFSDSSDAGLCKIIGDCLKEAVAGIGLVPYDYNLKIDKGESKNSLVHSSAAIEGNEGGLIVIDPALGQLDQKYREQIVVMPIDVYQKNMEGLLVQFRLSYKDTVTEKLADMEAEFEKFKNYEILGIIDSAEAVASNI